MAVRKLYHLNGHPLMYFLRVATFLTVCTAFVFGLVLLAWNSDTALSGKKNWILNRYYSMRSLHIHTIMNAKDESQTNLPSQWNSLGTTLEDSYSAHASTSKQELILYQSSDHYESYEKCIGGLDFHINSKCELEHVQSKQLLKNGESISILSSVSPALYILTLVTVYMLSATRIVSIVVADGIAILLGYRSVTQLKNVRRMTRRYTRAVLFFLVGLFYLSNVIFNFNIQMQEVDWFKFKLVMIVQSHMSSLLISVLGIAFYLVHLRSLKQSTMDFWLSERYDKKLFEEPAEIEYAVPLEHEEQPEIVEDEIVIQAEKDHSHNHHKTRKHKHTHIAADMELAGDKTMMVALTMPVLHNGLAMSTQSTAAPVPEPTNKPSLFGVCVSCLNFNTDTELVYPPHVSGAKEHGPVTSEASYIAAYTFFYGGIASLATVRGITLETNIQFVVFSVLGFGLLEVAAQKLIAWYWHLKMLAPTERVFKAIYNIVFFIRFVVLLLQFVFIWLWMSLVNEISVTYSTVYLITTVLVFLYWSLSVLGMVYEIALKIRALPAMSKFMRVYDSDGVIHHHYYNLWSDGTYTILAGILFIVAVFAVVAHNGHRVDDKLLHDIKLQYASLDHVELNNQCKFGFLKSSLLNGMGIFDETDATKYGNVWTSGAQDNWLKKDKHIDPFDVKVYKWTRGWYFSYLSAQGEEEGPSAWFCSNAFELGLNACSSADLTNVPTMVTDAAKKAFAYIYQSGQTIYKCEDGRTGTQCGTIVSLAPVPATSR